MSTEQPDAAPSTSAGARTQSSGDEMGNASQSEAKHNVPTNSHERILEPEPEQELKEKMPEQKPKDKESEQQLRDKAHQKQLQRGTRGGGGGGKTSKRPLTYREKKKQLLKAKAAARGGKKPPSASASAASTRKKADEEEVVAADDNPQAPPQSLTKFDGEKKATSTPPPTPPPPPKPNSLADKPKAPKRPSTPPPLPPPPRDGKGQLKESKSAPLPEKAVKEEKLLSSKVKQVVDVASPKEASVPRVPKEEERTDTKSDKAPEKFLASQTEKHPEVDTELPKEAGKLPSSESETHSDRGIKLSTEVENLRPSQNESVSGGEVPGKSLEADKNMEVSAGEESKDDGSGKTTKEIDRGTKECDAPKAELDQGVSKVDHSEDDNTQGDSTKEREEPAALGERVQTSDSEKPTKRGTKVRKGIRKTERSRVAKKKLVGSKTTPGARTPQHKKIERGSQDTEKHTQSKSTAKSSAKKAGRRHSARFSTPPRALSLSKARSVASTPRAARAPLKAKSVTSASRAARAPPPRARPKAKSVALPPRSPIVVDVAWKGGRGSRSDRFGGERKVFDAEDLPCEKKNTKRDRYPSMV